MRRNSFLTFLAFVFAAIVFFTANAHAHSFDYTTNLAERPLTLPGGLTEMGMDINVDFLTPQTATSSDSSMKRSVFHFRYGLSDELEFMPLGLKYRLTVDRIGDHEVAPHARLLNTGETFNGVTIWKSDAGLEGKVKLNPILAVDYQVENFHTFNPAINDQDLVGGSISAIICMSSHLSISGGGSYQALTNYSEKTGGYYNLQILLNTKKWDFMLEGLWGSSLGYVNMRDMTTPLGTQTFSGMLYVRF